MDPITIILQPKDLYAIDERQTGFVVQAVTEFGGNISYQWQKSTEPNVWKNVGVNSNIISFVASLSMNGTKYRAILTSGSYSSGFTVLASDEATVYVSPKPTITPTPTMTPTPTALPTKPRIYIPGVKNLVLDETFNRLYASTGYDVKVINTINNQILSNFSITSPANIWRMVGSDLGLHISDIINNQIIQISKSRGDIEKIINIDAFPMDHQLNDGFLYVLATSEEENSLRKFRDGQLLQKTILSEYSTDRFIKLTINRNNNKAYVLDASSESIIIVDLRYMEIDRTIFLPKGIKPQSMEIDLSSNLIYISTKDSGFHEFLLFNTNNNSILDSRISIPYTQNGEQLNVVNFNINSAKNKIYLADAYKSSPLFIMNTKDQTFSSIENLSGGCSSLVGGSNKLYVANDNSGIDFIQLNTEIFLSNNQIQELRGTGGIVGVLTNSENEVGNYELVAGLYDNNKFFIQGNKLGSKKEFNYEFKASYKIKVKYKGIRYQGENEFDINIISSKNPIKLSVGQNVQISSIDSSVQVTFENSHTEGDVFFEKIETPPSANLAIYTIRADAKVDGLANISLNIPGLNPNNNPFMLSYSLSQNDLLDIQNELLNDPLLNGSIPLTLDTNYPTLQIDDITGNIEEGTISGDSDINIIGGGLITIIVPGVNGPTTITVDPESWNNSDPVPDWLTVISGISDSPDPQNLLIPCEGNQTRSNVRITMQGVFTADCGCWEASIVGLTDIIGLATGLGTLKAGASAAFKGLLKNRLGKATLKEAIEQTVKKAAKLKEELAKLTKYGDDLVTEQMDLLDKTDMITGRGNQFSEQQRDIMKKRLKEIDEKLAEWKRTRDNAEIDRLTSEIDKLDPDDGFSSSFYNSKRRKLENELENLTDESGGAWREFGNAFTAYGVAAAGLAAAVLSFDEISVQKTCPSGQILDKITCECVPVCHGSYLVDCVGNPGEEVWVLINECSSGCIPDGACFADLGHIVEYDIGGECFPGYDASCGGTCVKQP